MKRQSKEAKALEKTIERAYYRVARGFQIDIMNISKIFNESAELIAQGTDLDAAVLQVALKYKEN